MSKKNVSLVPFGSLVVRDSNGEADKAATLAKIEEQFDAWVEMQTKDQDALAAAIESVYAKYGTVNAIPIPTLLSLAVAEVGFTPDNHKALTERAREVLRSNDRYQITKGQNGGCVSLSDAQLAEFRSTGKWTATSK